jgi:hypothetical protein
MMLMYLIVQALKAQKKERLMSKIKTKYGVEYVKVAPGVVVTNTGHLIFKRKKKAWVRGEPKRVNMGLHWTVMVFDPKETQDFPWDGVCADHPHPRLAYVCGYTYFKKLKHALKAIPESVKGVKPKLAARGR